VGLGAERGNPGRAVRKAAMRRGNPGGRAVRKAAMRRPGGARGALGWARCGPPKVVDVPRLPPKAAP
jgi:hypothetical protein